MVDTLRHRHRTHPWQPITGASKLITAATMRLDIKQHFSTRSDRVKGIDFHPTEPWVLTTLYSGKIEIWSYDTGSKVKSIDVTNVPVRAGKFIARKNWIIVGSDDFQVRIYNYNTGEKVAQFEAHPDYIRCIAVHPSLSYVLTSSDDTTIKLWNWDNNWKLEKVYEGHQHYVMSLCFNPKDINTFASACLDRTVKVWSLNSTVPNFTLLAHEAKGVNYVDYYPHSDKPYLITASDDKTIKVWDYQTKSCIATLEDHIANVSFAIFHPELPLIISGSEDSTIKIWNANTYKLEKSLNYSMERAWCVSTRKGSSLIAAGFDTGHVVIQLGDDKPLISMDPLGKIIWAKHTDIYNSIIKSNDVTDLKDGEVLPLVKKELGNIEIFPSSLDHSPNGRFVTVTGDGEYIIYTALAWRNKAYGKALEFVWSQDSNFYAIRESVSSVKIFKNFKEKPANSQIDLIYSADKIYGGTLLTVKSDGFVSFYDWESGSLVRRVDVDAQDIIWSEDGELILIISNDTVYTLKFNKEIFEENLNNGTIDSKEGCEESIELLYDFQDSVLNGKWAGDVFIYTSVTNRLNYSVGGLIYNLAHFDKPMYLLGYLPRDNKVYVCDKDINISSYNLSLKVLQYQTLVLRGELEEANLLLSEIDASEMTKIARFLEKQGQLDLAIEITNDLEQKFELAIKTLNFEIAKEIAELDNSKHKWKVLGDLSLKNWNIKLAVESYENSEDLESLLLIYSSINNEKDLIQLGHKAFELGKYNIAFQAYYAANSLKDCIELLQKTERYTEASILAKTYDPENSQGLTEIVELWKKSLVENGKEKLSERLIVPVSESLIDLNGDAKDEELPAEQEEVVEEPAEVEKEAEVEEDADVDGDEE